MHLILRVVKKVVMMTDCVGGKRKKILTSRPPNPWQDKYSSTMVRFESLAFWLLTLLKEELQVVTKGTVNCNFFLMDPKIHKKKAIIQ